MALLETLMETVGPDHVLTGERVNARAVGWADHSPCRARAIVRPGSTDEVSVIDSIRAGWGAGRHLAEWRD